MAHNIILLNLGDRADGGGLIAKTARNIKVKHPVKKTFLFAGNQVTEFSLFSLLAKYKAGAPLPLSDPELQQVRNLSSNASKIMICLHGLHNDVDSGHANDTLNATPMAAVASYTDLANLILRILPIREKDYDVALIMCYGARSENFRLDHTGMIAAGDLRTSFAYKFYRRICVFRGVRMTARTGATAFDETTGRSMVESESSVVARADREDFLRLAQTQTEIADYIALKDSYTKAASGGSEARSLLWMALDGKFRANPGLVAARADEAKVRAYHQIVKAKNAFQHATTGQDKNKYGKYVYTYNSNKGLTILSKYPKPGVVLYEGALI